MVDRRRAVEIGLIVSGLFLIFGGLREERTGDVTNAFPMWYSYLGIMLITAGAWLYLMRQ